ncbi:hypothetical protein Clacol_006792 [Clathrus columnatus]|uniref:Uncharacterized protein n=1 Tax=Clathrus columnatus TaxID=1419009 RepID=A0AAV5AIN7_9AGAM|nr:hypothetical protein Clacol_006792 [Clathrus columnatus]
MALRSDRQFGIPSLSYYCYKYINAHLDCELPTIFPHVPPSTKYGQSLKAGQVSSPKCWREQYYTCRREEEKRFEEIGSRIRNRREEADQEKKERQVILTDKLPPAKRSRFNSGGTTRSKSLFEKARADSLRVQRLVYGPSILPPPMHSKAIKPRSSPVNTFSPSKSAISLPRKSPALPKDKDTESQDFPSSKSIPQSVGNSSGSAKRDPMATLFMPKHKAYSQRPSGPSVSVQRK